MSKWLLVHSSSGYQCIQECDLLAGPADVSADVDYNDLMGQRVSGVIIAMDKSKKKMVNEMGRHREIQSANGTVDPDEESDTGSVSSSIRRSSRSSSIAAASSSRAPTPRPTMVGKAPLSAPKLSRKRNAPGLTSAVKRPAVDAAAAATTTPRRPMPSFPLLSGSQATGGGLLHTPAQASYPLIPPSQMPNGFSLTGSPPLVLPTTSDDAAFRNFMMQSMVQMHSEISGIKLMVNNLFLGWNSLILQSANRSTSTHQEVSGTRDRLTDVSNAVKQVESVVQKVSAQMGERKEFSYAPYCAKEDIDIIDRSQGIASLATAIQKIVYDESDQMDNADLSLSYNKRSNMAKAKFVVDAALYRRMVSSSENQQTVRSQIIERINNYANKRRREQKEKGISSESINRLKGRKGQGVSGEMEEDNEDMTRMAAGREIQNELNNNGMTKALKIKKEKGGMGEGRMDEGRMDEGRMGDGGMEEDEVVHKKRRNPNQLRFDSDEDDDEDSSESSLLDI